MKTKEEKKTEKNKSSNSKSLRFLYGTIVGGAILVVLTRKSVSKLSSVYADSKQSTKLIKPFIKKNHIDMSDYEDKKYKTFNEFFTRKILPGKRPISDDPKDVIAVADSKLLYYEIKDDLTMHIKGKVYTVEDLLRNKSLSDEYRNGICLVFRLDVDDYHRYSFIDSGKVIGKTTVNGILHTVQSIAFRKHKVLKENQREYSILETDNFGKVIQMEIGALLVGKIKNHNKRFFTRGEEKGYFLYGGSTVVVLFKKNAVKIKKKIITNSNKDVETKVKLGETIGEKLY